MGKTSRSLEVISGQSGNEGLERRRVPRLNLAAEHFLLKENSKVYSLADLSSGGMAVRILEHADLALFSVGHQVQGVLNLHREKFPVIGRVKHLRPDLAGVEFESLAAETVRALGRFLDPAELGRELRPLPSSTDESATWFHGPTGTDVLVWRQPSGNLGRVAIFLFSSYVQWDPELGLSTGYTQPAEEASEVRGAVRFDTLLLKPDDVPDSAKLDLAKTLVLSSNMPVELKNWCVKCAESKDS
ncbi:MAG: PilZ domain-containing protein [Bdellovibrionales bacterium]|nr:PilZ domain-containing protein [Bdellovibrionales bacterium]